MLFLHSRRLMCRVDTSTLCESRGTRHIVDVLSTKAFSQRDKDIVVLTRLECKEQRKSVALLCLVDTLLAKLGMKATRDPRQPACCSIFPRHVLLLEYAYGYSSRAQTVVEPIRRTLAAVSRSLFDNLLPSIFRIPHSDFRNAFARISWIERDTVSSVCFDGKQGYCRRRALMLGMHNCHTLRPTRLLTSSDLSLWRRETMTTSQLAEVSIVSSGSVSFRASHRRRRTFDKLSSLDGSS